MKVVAIDPILSHDDKLDYFHHVMFHGEIIPAQRPGGPLRMIRSGWRIPDVMAPTGCWIVSEEVRRKLEGVPGLTFEEIRFAKLVERPWELGRFDHYNARGRFQDPVKFLQRAPDVPALHKGVGPYYVLSVPSVEDLAPRYPPTPPIPIDLDEYVSEKVGLLSAAPDPVVLSVPLLKDNPLVEQDYVFMTEGVYALLRPHLDKDFFALAKLELKE